MTNNTQTKRTQCHISAMQQHLHIIQIRHIQFKKHIEAPPHKQQKQWAPYNKYNPQSHTYLPTQHSLISKKKTSTPLIAPFQDKYITHTIQRETYLQPTSSQGLPRNPLKPTA